MAGGHAENKLDQSVGGQQQTANTLALSNPQTQAAIEYYKKTGDLAGALKNIKGTGAVMDAKGQQAQKTIDEDNAYFAKTGKHQYGPDQLKDAQDQVKQGTTQTGTSDGQMSAAIKAQLFSDPETASLLASQQVQNDPLSSGMFGKGGIQDQRQADESNLTKTAYDWNAQDETAMGTAAGNINRQYGAEQGNLARALSSRGFGSADSGVAASQFAGMQGNTSDRLAAAQQNLANNRMQVGLQRLTAARNAVNQAQGMAQGAMTDQFNRNMAGIGRGDKQIANSWAQSKDSQDQANKQFEQEQESGINPVKIISGAATGALSAAGGKGLGGLMGPSASTDTSSTPYTNSNYKLPSFGSSYGKPLGTG